MKPHAGEQGSEPGMSHPGRDEQGNEDESEGVEDVDRVLPQGSVVND